MSAVHIPVPTKVNGYPVISAVALQTSPGEFANQWVVICQRPSGHSYSPDRVYLTWLVAYDPAWQGGSYVAHEGCYDLTRDEADVSLRQRTAGGRKHLQYLAREGD